MKNVRLWLKKNWPILAVTLLGIALIFEAKYFVNSVQKFYSQGELRPVHYRHESTVPAQSVSTQKQAPKATTNVSTIQLWMTFDYLNVVFKLPPNYLKDILGSNDSSYPNISLDSYAKRNHIDSQLLLQIVQQYITSYKNR